MKKFQVTEKGAWATGKEGEKQLKFGAIIELNDDEPLPGMLVGKVREIPEIEGGMTAITNPKMEDMPSRSEILAAAAAELKDDEFTADGQPDVRALNDLLTDGVAPFDAEERNALWPDVADQVKEARA